jgi:hypothetical protein
MAQRPQLPLQEEAEIERAREHLLGLAKATWPLLFPQFPPHSSDRPKPANLQLQLREYSCALLDLEAQYYMKRSPDDATLRSWLESAATSIESAVLKETESPRHEFHCTKTDRRLAIMDALSARVEFWINKAGTDFAVAMLRAQGVLDESTKIMRGILGTPKPSVVPATLLSTQPPQISSESKQKRATHETFPHRGKWLRDRLKERGWNKNHLSGFGGPDRKTVQRVLDGFAVREEVLEKLVTALNKKKVDKVINLLDIPYD